MAGLMTYGGSSLLIRGGALATSIACCCNCPIGTIVYWAFYFTDADRVYVGEETDWTDDVLAEFLGKFYGFDLSAVFWAGNTEATPDPVNGKYYYGEFQIWCVANCCGTPACEDFYYEDKALNFANNWSRITDASSQFEWDPPWAVGSCAGNTIENDRGIGILFDCVVDGLSFPSDPATGDFVLRKSIEVCCE